MNKNTKFFHGMAPVRNHISKICVSHHGFSQLEVHDIIIHIMEFLKMLYSKEVRNQESDCWGAGSGLAEEGFLGVSENCWF